MEIRAELVFEGTRKALVNDIANALGVKAQYQGAPTFAYKVACFTFTRDNQLVWTSEEQTTEATDVMDSLFRAGRFEYSRVWFDGEELPSDAAPLEIPIEEPITGEFIGESPAETATVAPTSEETEPAGITAPEAEPAPAEPQTEEFSINMELDTFEKFLHLIAQKHDILKMAIPAFRTNSVQYQEDMVTVTFDPFWETSEDREADNGDDSPYRMLVEKMVEMAKAAKRISTKQNPVVNPKYQFRCFLLRLGFIGKEYGPMRKALMQNLTGNSAWLRGSKDA